MVALISLALTVGSPVALGALGHAKGEEADRLIAALEDPRPERRAAAAAILGDEFAYSKRVREPLKKALGDENAEVRLAAAGSLARIGDFSAGDQMVDTLFWIDCEYPDDHFEMIEFMLNSGDPDIEAKTEQWLTS
ncbi:MAG: HEAT repeat domain-containing protein, partial [Pseudomonadota bacterium]